MTQPPPSPLAQPLPWDLVAPAYSQEVVPFFERFAEAAIEAAALPAGARALDVAAGPGTLALKLAPRVAHVTAIDFAPGMLAELRTRAGALGIGNVEAKVGDGMSLQFPDESFDAAFSLFGLIFFPDRAKGFAELRRVLRPGAPALVTSWAPFDQMPFLKTVFGAMREVIPGLPFGTAEAPLSEPAAFERELGGAGFGDISVTALIHSMEFPSVADAWASLERTMAPLVLLRRNMGEPAFGDFSAKVLKLLEATLGRDQARWDAHAWLGVGRR